MTGLRPYQDRAMGMLRQSLGRGNRRPMLQLPTGAGKTRIAATVVQGALDKGNQVIFTVPAISLIDQTVQAFWEQGIRDVGVIQANHEFTNPNMPIQVASVQTLMRRTPPMSDVVIVDEAHRWFKFYGEWMNQPGWERVPFIGLSATPWTKGLGKYFDDLLVCTTTRELIDNGYLAPFRVFAPSHPDLSKVRTVAGDYHEGELAEVMGDNQLVADVVRTWQERADDQPTLCFAVDRAHAMAIQLRFQEAGIPAGYMDANTPLEERESIRRAFHDGDLKVVCNVGVLTTGVDWDVRVISYCRPTKSKILFVQIIGRALRTADGKSEALILDHSDTHLRLGFVTDIHQDSLDMGKTRKSGDSEREPPLPKECPSCTFLKPAGARKCPMCGFETQPQSDVVAGSGELRELGGKRIKMNTDEKRIFFAELKWIALRRGYSKGWAAHKFRERTGVWPNAYKYVAPREPSPATLSWVKSRQIAWAKSRKGEAA